MFNPIAWFVCLKRGFHRFMVADLAQFLRLDIYHIRGRCLTCGLPRSQSCIDWQRLKAARERMIMSALPKCPQCGTNSKTVAQGEIFACRKCGGLFDGDPDEGGDFSNRDPSARLNRNEQHRKRPVPQPRRR